MSKFSFRYVFPLLLILVMIPVTLGIVYQIVRFSTGASSENIVNLWGKLLTIKSEEAGRIFTLNSGDGSFVEIQSPGKDLSQYVDKNVLLNAKKSIGLTGYNNSLVYIIDSAKASLSVHENIPPAAIEISPTQGISGTQFSITSNYSFGPREIVIPCGKSVCTASWDVKLYRGSTNSGNFYGMSARIITWGDKVITANIPTLVPGNYLVDFFLENQQVTNFNTSFFVQASPLPTPIPTFGPNPTPTPIVFKVRYSVPWYIHKVMGQSTSLMIHNSTDDTQCAEIKIYKRSNGDLKDTMTDCSLIPHSSNGTFRNNNILGDGFDGNAIVDVTSPGVTVSVAILDIDSNGNPTKVSSIMDAIPIPLLPPPRR